MSRLRVSCSKEMLIDSSHGGNCTNQRNTESYSSWTDKPRVAKDRPYDGATFTSARTVNSMLRPDHSLQQNCESVSDGGCEAAAVIDCTACARVIRPS